jgi:hypothetical protein
LKDDCLKEICLKDESAGLRPGALVKAHTFGLNVASRSAAMKSAKTLLAYLISISDGLVLASHSANPI